MEMETLVIPGGIVIVSCLLLHKRCVLTIDEWG